MHVAAGRAAAQTVAPGAPGRDAQWATAGKQGVGTSASLESKVWFTLADGVMTEVYYPDVTVANVHMLQFVVVDPASKRVETEKDDALHTVAVPRADSLTFVQTNTAKSGAWKIVKTYVTDPARPTVAISVRFESRNPKLKLYVYYDPSLGNSGMGDSGSARITGDISGAAHPASLTVVDGKIASALVRLGDLDVFEEVSNGFLGTSDGLLELRSSGKLGGDGAPARDGNVVQVAKAPILGPNKTFTIVLGFGANEAEAGAAARLTLDAGFAATRAAYEKGWAEFVRRVPRVLPKYQPQLNMAAMILKAHEDKTVRGANIASLTVPWGGGDNANENKIGGYHLIWARDLYQVATAYMALGDREAAVRATRFLFDIQQKPDGSFPQNSFLDGKPFWGSLQMDEVAYPLILAHELGLDDKNTYDNHVRKAADFIVANGPWTPQERWEEEAGYSPSTIAAEIAGLVCAAEIAKKNGDEARAIIYLGAADEWARNIERMTATTTGKYGDGNYYLRLTQNANPDSGDKLELNNGAGTFDEREIVDAGFLELVRLGIKPASDPLIAKSLKVIDDVLRVKTPNGDAFYRYNGDGYGEMDDGRPWNFDGKYTGKGRPWPIFSGERGQYELALNATNPKSEITSSKSRLDAMLGFANDGRMIPEQVWDKPAAPKNYDRQFVPELKFGEGTGSATPLAWSMAQFVRLAVNVAKGRNLDTPQVVFDRYAKNGIPRLLSNFGGLGGSAVVPVPAGTAYVFRGQTQPGTKIAYRIGDGVKLATAGSDGTFAIDLFAPEKEETATLAAVSPNGATAFEKLKFRAVDRLETPKFAPETLAAIKSADRSPIIENGRAVFVYKGAAKFVTIAGDITGWAAGRIFMTPVGDGVMAAAVDVRNDARFEYKLVVDGEWKTDPLNPIKLDNGVGGENSVVEMPGYRPSPWAVAPAGMTKSAISVRTIRSAIYGDKTIKVYVPEGFEKTPLPVLYVNDGSESLNRIGADVVQRNLVAAGRTKPFIMVFLDPGDRMKEYFANDDYARYLATEVVPYVDANFATIRDRARRGVIGASLGGVTSVWATLKYPAVFGFAGAMSASWWVDDERVPAELRLLNASTQKFRFYIDDGALEGVDDSRRVVVMLRGKGFAVTYVESEAGHNWTAWRDRLAEAFVAFMN